MTLALALKDVNKTYANGTQAVSNVNLNIESGEFCALLGANGAGKSTLIGMICSLVRKTSGTIVINGHNLDVETEQAKRQLGIMPQEFNLNHFENPLQILIQQGGYFGMTYQQARRRALELLDQVQLTPHLKKQSRMLSGGMKRRLMLARSLMHSPKIIILDEPTAGVDIEIREELWRVLTALHQEGLTIVLATHYLEEAEAHCQSLALIRDGQVLLKESMQKVLEQLPCHTIALETTDAIENLPDIKGFHITQTGSHKIQAALSESQTLSELITILGQHRIFIQTLGVDKTRLEQVFNHFISGS